MKEKEFNNIAVLIDAENISAKHVKRIFEKIAIYGNISVRRIYGDWHSEKVKSWREILQEHALLPIQQFNNTGTKNVSDFTIVIDAMDLVHEGIFDCFCFVTSDSDFTRLVQRLKEKGKFVIGIGEEKAPKAFKNACNEFIPLNAKEAPIKIAQKNVLQTKTAKTKKSNDKDIFTEHTASVEGKLLIDLALDNLQEDDGWVLISKIIPYVQRIKSDFKIEDLLVNNRPVTKLISYFNDPLYEINKTVDSGPGPIYVRKR